MQNTIKKRKEKKNGEQNTSMQREHKQHGNKPCMLMEFPYHFFFCRNEHYNHISFNFFWLANYKYLYITTLFKLSILPKL